MNKLLLSGYAYPPNLASGEMTVLIEQGRIARVTPGPDPAADIVTEGFILPGFIDLQVNGAYGFDFSTDGYTVTDVAARLPETGVTAFLPTIITSPLEEYPKRLAEIRKVSQGATGTQVLGVHLEGPYLNPSKRGAHNPAHIRSINVDEITRWADETIVRIVTLAPELPGALDAIKALRAKGIVVSAGHSNATFAEARSGFEAGISWGTHLFNAMRNLDHREPGLVGALLSSGIQCGLIADGIHVHPAMLEVAHRALAAPTLVTDAMAAMGMPPGRYRLSDRDVIVDGTSARLEDGTLAGSILTMDQAVRNMIQFTSSSLVDAQEMTSGAPASVLGLERKGRIATGYDADLVILDKSLRVTHTIVAGQVVYARRDA